MQRGIGLGRAVAIEEIQIRRPGSDTRQRFEDVAPDPSQLTTRAHPCPWGVAARTHRARAN